jgi:hypothetical protein
MKRILTEGTKSSFKQLWYGRRKRAKKECAHEIINDESKPYSNKMKICRHCGESQIKENREL